MNDPELYTSANYLQKRDARTVLERMKDELPWNNGENILDVGCGPGDITTSLLIHYLPQDANIVGCDISEAMVMYAQKKYGNEQFSFKQLDISNPNIWMNWEEGVFDKIFSFHCLHWVADQRQAAKNMNALLKFNGYIVTMFVISHPVLTILKEISELPKWKYLSKYLYSWDEIHKSNSDSKTEYVKILEECCFDVVNCFINEKISVHQSMEEFIVFFDSVNPFKRHISKNKNKEFLEDCKQLLLQDGLLSLNEEGGIVLKYTLITTNAKKVGNL
uniref:Putative farnesoic acid o-methyltransferase n=1 Tax=Panstrongylus megistus TaxID=65343 RepID=A0A069DR98_9HEMI